MTPSRRAALLGFSLFGVAWGAWEAAVPQIRSNANASDAGLGLALLAMAGAAMPTMLVTGRIMDRVGPNFCAVVVPAFALVWIAVPLSGSVLALAIALAALGALSGAVDVAINTAAVTAERDTRQPVLPVSHGLFSAGVVVGALVSGAARELDVPLTLVFAMFAGVSIAAIPWLRGGPAPPPEALLSTSRRRPPWMAPVIVLGLLCLVAYFVENAHQTWNAVELEDVHDARPALGAAAPMLFAITTATTRFSLQRLVRLFSSATIMGAGAALAAAGTGLVAVSPNAAVAFVGIFVAGVGTAVVAPTLFSVSGVVSGPAERGRAVSIVATIGYGGFLISPPIVGGIAAVASLPWAYGAVAIVAAISAPTGAFFVRRVEAGRRVVAA